MPGYAEVTLEQASQIPGNASASAKHFVINYIGHGFANSIGEKLKVVEVSVNKMRDGGVKMEGRLVYEIVTSEGAPHFFCLLMAGIDEMTDMLNGGGSVHGGCKSHSHP